MKNKKLLMSALFIVSMASVPYAQKANTYDYPQKSRIIDGVEYTTYKNYDNAGNPHPITYREDGTVISRKDFKMLKNQMRKKRKQNLLNRIDSDIISLLDSDEADKPITMHVSFENEQNTPPDLEEDSEFGSVTYNEHGEEIITLNGTQVDRETLNANNARKHKKIMKRLKRKQRHKKRVLSKLLSANKKYFTVLNKDLNRTENSIEISIAPENVKRFLKKYKAVITDISLPHEAIDNAAYNSTWNNSSSVLPFLQINPSTYNGSGIGIYQTEGGCADPANVPGDYTRLYGSNTEHANRVVKVLKKVVPSSHVYCRSGIVVPTLSDLALTSPGIHIVNASSGYSLRYGKYEIEDRDWDNFVYDNNIPVIAASGNNQYHNWVHTVSAAYNVIAVGNYDWATNDISSKSSYLNPITGVEKPEIVATGEQFNFTYSGTTVDKSGTSYSAPLLTGMVAAKLARSSFYRFQPALIKARLLAGANINVNHVDYSGEKAIKDDDKVGVGATKFNSFYYNASIWWVNASTSYFDSHNPNDRGIEYKFNVTSSSNDFTIAASWLLRGDYAKSESAGRDPQKEYDRGNHDIGLDIDLKIYDPDGNVVGSSTSGDNNYEIVELKNLTKTGTYTAAVYKYNQNDNNNRLKLGVAIKRN